MVDLRDQVVDALGSVLPALVQVEDLLFERADARFALADRSTQVRVLARDATVVLDQTDDRALETIEIVRLCSPIRDRRNPPW